MNILIIIAAFATMAFAAPVEQGVSLTQDTLGNYNLKLISEDVDREEQGFESGKVIGSYSYTDKEGQHHKITYVAAPNAGFIATGDLPQQVQDTPEVAEARRRHLAVVKETRALLPELKDDDIIRNTVYVPTLPLYHEEPVVVNYIDNTAELEAAKAEHFAAHHVALARLAEEYARIMHH